MLASAQGRPQPSDFHWNKSWRRFARKDRSQCRECDPACRRFDRRRWKSWGDRKDQYTTRRPNALVPESIVLDRSKRRQSKRARPAARDVETEFSWGKIL